jgi:hypothetical protein
MADCMTLRSHSLRLTDSRKVALVTGRSGGQPISLESVETFNKVIDVILRGSFLVLANAVESLQHSGRIVAFSTSGIAKSFPSLARMRHQKPAWKH